VCVCCTSCLIRWRHQGGAGEECLAENDSDPGRNRPMDALFAPRLNSLARETKDRRTHPPRHQGAQEIGRPPNRRCYRIPDRNAFAACDPLAHFGRTPCWSLPLGLGSFRNTHRPRMVRRFVAGIPRNGRRQQSWVPRRLRPVMSRSSNEPFCS
jgi:hypothetical protein